MSFEDFSEEASRLSIEFQPESSVVLDCQDRHLFALGFMAGQLSGSTLLLPPDQGRLTQKELHKDHPRISRLDDEDIRALVSKIRGVDHTGVKRNTEGCSSALEGTVLTFTSGTCGTPKVYPKSSATLRISAGLINQFLGGVRGVRILATVPSQHMYGLETSILLPIFQGAILDGRRPFYPADIVHDLEDGPDPVALVTSPFHLSTLLKDPALVMPSVKCIVSATAPLSRELAVEAENRFGAPLYEIYGCTELGSIAGRRTAVLDEWRWFDGVMAIDEAGKTRVTASHVPGVCSRADQISPGTHGRFILEGRDLDQVNVAGKRTSLTHLERQALQIEGVHDIAFLQTDQSLDAIGRLGAVVVCDPALSRARLKDQLIQNLDPAFVPRTLVFVDEIPRNATGKVSKKVLEQLIFPKVESE